MCTTIECLRICRRFVGSVPPNAQETVEFEAKLTAAHGQILIAHLCESGVRTLGSGGHSNAQLLERLRQNDGNRVARRLVRWNGRRSSRRWIDIDGSRCRVSCRVSRWYGRRRWHCGLMLASSCVLIRATIVLQLL